MCSCAECTLGHLVVKSVRWSIPGYLEEKTCPLTLCSLFPRASVPAVNCRIPWADCIVLQLAWLCWIIKQIFLKCQFIGISIEIKEESVQLVQQASTGLPHVLETNQILNLWHNNGKWNRFLVDFCLYCDTLPLFHSLKDLFSLCLHVLILAFLSKFLFYMLIPWLRLIPVKSRSFYRYCWCSPCILSYFIAACSLCTVKNRGIHCQILWLNPQWTLKILQQ